MLLVFVPVLVASSAPAHDSWINRGGFKSPVSNEWCCGEGDCFVVPKNNVSMRRDGYSLNGAEIVPFAEALPSPDGAFWRCKRPDGTRRCFFAPPPGS
jgi:hypothetical protein